MLICFAWKHHCVNLRVGGSTLQNNSLMLLPVHGLPCTHMLAHAGCRVQPSPAPSASASRTGTDSYAMSEGGSSGLGDNADTLSEASGPSAGEHAQHGVVEAVVGAHSKSIWGRPMTTLDRFHVACCT